MRAGGHPADGVLTNLGLKRGLRSLRLLFFNQDRSVLGLEVFERDAPIWLRFGGARPACVTVRGLPLDELGCGFAALAVRLLGDLVDPALRPERFVALSSFGFDRVIML